MSEQDFELVAEWVDANTVALLPPSGVGGVKVSTVNAWADATRLPLDLPISESLYEMIRSWGIEKGLETPTEAELEALKNPFDWSKLDHAELASLADDPCTQYPMYHWYWCRFCDSTRPVGRQFLGVAIVRATRAQLAELKCDRLEIHPGGDPPLVAPIPAFMVVPEDKRNRLLSKAETQLLATQLDAQASARLEGSLDVPLSR